MTVSAAHSGKPSGFVDAGVLPCDLDKGIARRAAIGLVVLATDQTMEHEFRRLLPLDGIGIYCTRVFNDADITPDTLRAIGARITPGTELILPGLPLDVVGFGCTSATMTLGEEFVFEQESATRHRLHDAGDGCACGLRRLWRETYRRRDALCACRK
jgi:maleate isomerase